MKVILDKVKVGDVVDCEDLGGVATVYHVDNRGVFVYSKDGAMARMGHSGSASGVKSPIPGHNGHWNFWVTSWQELTVVKRVKRFKGNS